MKVHKELMKCCGTSYSPAKFYCVSSRDSISFPGLVRNQGTVQSVRGK
jgi:hypothetical protein